MRHDRDDRHRFVDEGDGAVLHLPRGIPLGVDVGDLLQLERALERDGIVDAPPEVQKITSLIEPLRDLLGERIALERLLEEQRQLRQRLEVRPRLVPRQRPANLSEIDRQQVQRHELSGEGLRGRDANLRPGVRVHRPLGLARRHAADHVADGDAARPLLLRLA